MKTKLFMAMAAATMMLASCGNEESESVDNWKGEIRLSSGIATQTRAAQSTQIQSGEIVYAWADKTPSTADYIKAWKLTANGSGSLTGNSQVYPIDGNLDFYALHGNFSTEFTEGTTAFPSAATTHSVIADQSNTDMKDYAKSDLLYAVKKDVARSSSAVVLPFYHMLSKVEVALKSGDGSPALSGATVTIEGTKLKADFTPNKAKDITKQSDRAGMIALTSASNDAAPITIKTVITTNFGSNSDYGEAIVVPQELAKDAAFIKVVLSGGGTFTYKLPEALTLASGKKYTYKITVNQSGLTVSSTITDWESAGDATEGDATM